MENEEITGCLVRQHQALEVQQALSFLTCWKLYQCKQKPPVLGAFLLPIFLLKGQALMPGSLLQGPGLPLSPHWGVIFQGEIGSGLLFYEKFTVRGLSNMHEHAKIRTHVRKQTATASLLEEGTPSGVRISRHLGNFSGFLFVWIILGLYTRFTKHSRKSWKIPLQI